MIKIKSINISKKVIIFITFILVAFLGYLAFTSSSKSSYDSLQKKTLAEVKKSEIVDGIVASGHVESANYLPITTSVNGIVKKVYVKEGDSVVKGQKIMDVTLNADGEEAYAQSWASYLSAKNSVEQLKTNLISKKSAFLTSQDSFDNEKKTNSYQSHKDRLNYSLAENSYTIAKNEVNQQENAIVAAEATLRKAWLTYQAQSPTITASDSGIIANIVVVEGMDISNSLSERTSSAVASIKKEGTPIISLEISELDINKIKIGQKVQVNVNSIENKTFEGSVVGIDKIGAINNNVTTYAVIVRFTDSSDFVLPNMGVEANVVINSKQDVLIIPNSAIISENKAKFVELLKEGKTIKAEIKTGLTDGLNTEVLSGLSAGDQVYIKSLKTSGFTESQSQGQNQRNVFRTNGLFMR